MIQTALQSPQFLYHVDRAGTPRLDGASRLDGPSLAARLSYALQQAPPDDELLALAASGSLLDPATIEQQATRLLQTERAHATTSSFHEQWLGLEALQRLQPDPVKYPGFNGALRDAMSNQARQFLLNQLQTTAPVFPGLFAALPPTLDATEAAFGGVRTGILMLPAFLTTHPTFIQRGKAIRNAVLCQVIPAPPPEAGMLPSPLPNESERDRWWRCRARPTLARAGPKLRVRPGLRPSPACPDSSDASPH